MFNKLKHTNFATYQLTREFSSESYLLTECFLERSLLSLPSCIISSIRLCCQNEGERLSQVDYTTPVTVAHIIVFNITIHAVLKPMSLNRRGVYSIRDEGVSSPPRPSSLCTDMKITPHWLIASPNWILFWRLYNVTHFVRIFFTRIKLNVSIDVSHLGQVVLYTYIHIINSCIIKWEWLLFMLLGIH